MIYQNLEKLIKFSQSRFDEPLKLNNDFLSMTSNKLERIAGLLNWHHLQITKPITEEKIGEYLKEVGLSQYKPEKYAHPEPNDIDEQFF